MNTLLCRWTKSLLCWLTWLNFVNDASNLFCLFSFRGMKTLMSESYTMPPERKRWELFSLDVPKPWHAPLESKNTWHTAVKHKYYWKNVKTLVAYHTVFSFTGPGPGETFRVPRMYNTEYQFYGSEKPVTIWELRQRLLKNNTHNTYLGVLFPLSPFKGNINVKSLSGP